MDVQHDIFAHTLLAIQTAYLASRVQIALPLVAANEVFGVRAAEGSACGGGLRIEACVVRVCVSRDHIYMSDG